MTGVPDGWPCALLSADPPSVLDREAGPTGDELLPQILALTPRGAAWGTDEAGDGSGASPVQRGFWRGIAAWVADHLGRDFTAASQALPSALTYTLGDWETELGLPDACGGATDPAGRALAVQARFGELGGSSPAYFVCLAKSRGYSITIEEPTQFLCSVSECVGPEVEETWFTCGASQCGRDQIHGLATGAVPTYGDPVAGSTPDETFFTCGDSQCGLDAIHGREIDNPNGSVWKLWIVHIQSGGTTFFTAGAGQCGRDPISGFVDAPALECLIRAKTPPSTQVVFAYDA